MDRSHHPGVFSGHGVVVVVDKQPVAALVTGCRRADVLEESLEAGDDLLESLFVD